MINADDWPTCPCGADSARCAGGHAANL